MKIIGIILFTFTSLMISSQPKVYFINIEDGDSLESPFLVQFGLSNMGIAPAGIDKENTGHHHLLIDVEDINFNMPIPSSSNHIHFGGGQTETLVTLSPGEYSLQLLVGDKFHIPHNPPVISEKIKIRVTR